MDCGKMVEPVEGGNLFPASPCPRPHPASIRRAVVPYNALPTRSASHMSMAVIWPAMDGKLYNCKPALLQVDVLRSLVAKMGT